MLIENFQESMHKQRSDLLNASLRQGFNVNYSIEKEYPIVLAAENGHYSFCLRESKSMDKPLSPIVAHANFWPRLIIDERGDPQASIALVGNVATDTEARNQGYMSYLIEYLWSLHQDRGFSALMLWSDLSEFYHKFGFESCGAELRYRFGNSGGLRRTFDPGPRESVHRIDSQGDCGLLAEIFRLRVPVRYTLQRSLSEFEALLRIPDTALLVLMQDVTIKAFCIVGKGVDMANVVHEWGGNDPDEIIKIISYIFAATGWDDLLLLSPKSIAAVWQRKFDQVALGVGEHGVALVKTLPGSGVEKILDQTFVWGLDAI